MEQYNMRANFYPLKEPVNGFIGNADLSVSNIVKLRGIAVFENAEGGGHHIQFPGFQGTDGKQASFIAVQAPNLPPYEKNGEQVYPPIFKGLKSTYTVDGQQKQTDYAQVIQAMVISERKNLLEKKTALTDKINDASQKAGQAAPAQDAPVKDTQR